MTVSKYEQHQKLHYIVLSFVGVFALIAASYPIAMWRVSQMEKFKGFHVKSVPISEPSKIVQVSPSVPTVLAGTQSVISPSENTEITDSNQLAELRQKLYEQIDTAWQTWPTFSRNLVYQVSVNSSGGITSYISLNEFGDDYLQEIPLAQLSTPQNSATSLGQFIVIFTPNGELEVTPWQVGQR